MAAVFRSPIAQAQGDFLPRRQRAFLTGGVLGAHVLAVWGLLQVDAVRNAAAEVAPLLVEWIAPAAPLAIPLPPPAPPPAPPKIVKKAPPPPVISAKPSPAPAPFVVAPSPPEPIPPKPLAVTPEPAPPAPLPPAPPAVPRLVPIAEVGYLTPPTLAYPKASERLGEAGVVQVRVLVDAQGAPRQVSVHKSSGYPRLDEAALSAMRGARFKPRTEDGAPVAWYAIAPFHFDN